MPDVASAPRVNSRAPIDAWADAVVSEIRALDPHGYRIAQVFLGTFDQLYDGQRTGRYVRLRAHLNSRVKVPDLADTVGPVTESNCAGATPPGGKQLEVNDQSVTRSGTPDKVNSIRSAVLASLRSTERSPNKIVPPALREWNASGGEPQMVGDGMIGRSSDVNQGTTTGGTRAGWGQSPRSSEETGNDRGAKGDRDVVLGDVGTPSQKGPGSAARLSAWMHRRSGPGVRRRLDSGPPENQVSGAQACAAGTTPPKPWSREPEPVHRKPRTGKPDAGKPPVRFGWGATERSVLYPHSARHFNRIRTAGSACPRTF
jgi:hypothetical protein